MSKHHDVEDLEHEIDGCGDKTPQIREGVATGGVALQNLLEQLEHFIINIIFDTCYLSEKHLCGMYDEILLCCISCLYDEILL